MLDTLTTDLRIAARTLIKARGFTAAVILTLGLGMALSAAVLLVIKAYLIRSLPYPAASRLYSVRYAPPGEATPRGLERLDWRSLDDVIEHPIAWDLDMFYLIGGEHAESAPGAWVTPGFMQGLGIQPAAGRGFDAEAFRTGGPQVALISHALWQRRFGGDPSILGRRFQAYVSDRPEEAETFTIVGVLPPGFWHVNPYTDLLTPLRAATYPYLVRLREGVPAADAAARITALVRAGAISLRHDWQAELASVHEGYVSRVRPILRAVAWAAGLVLLVAAANVAALLLIRATRRQREIAVRMALGAGRAGIARLLAIEAVLLGAGATAVGLAASGLTIPSLAPIIQRVLGRPAPGGETAFGIDATSVAIAAAIGLLIALACAVLPLAASWQSNLQQALHRVSRTATEGRGSQRARSILIALEIAASLALLAGTVLMAQSVVRMLRVDFGVRAEHVLTAPLALRQRSYPGPASRLAFYERLLPRLGAIPGVESAALGDWFPLQQPRLHTIRAQGAQGAQGAAVQAAVLAASAGWFGTLGAPIVAGREFGPADRQGSEPVAVVSQTLAARLWPTESAIGARVVVPERGDADEAKPVVRIVVGVARDVRQGQADEELADVYVPLSQAPSRFGRLYVRTNGVPTTWTSAVRSALREIDPEVSLDRATSLQAAIDEQAARPKFLASLLGGFALVAALLALVGVYSVIAYAVRQREREIAVRMAIGADPRRITGLFLRQGGFVLASGLALGVLASAGAGRLLESQLFGVRPGDPLSLLAVCAAFAGAGLCAVWWPARRAAATDPAGVLKEE